MFIAKSNEEKRSMAWRIVISTASVLIILIGAFFLFKMFTGNPLEGTWKSTEQQLVLTIKGNGTLLVDWEEIFEDEKMTIGMESLDKDSKTVTFKADEEALLEAEENDCCRDRTDEYAEHQHAIIYSVAAEQVRYQHRHGNGIIVL